MPTCQKNICDITCTNTYMISLNVNFFRYQTSVFPLDSSKQVEPPTVSTESKNIYETYIQRGKTGATTPNQQTQNIYFNYVRNKYS